MLSLVPKKGQVMLEMANLLCGPEVANSDGGISTSPNGTPNGSRTRNSLLSGIDKSKSKFLYNYKAYIDSMRRGHVTSRKGEILTVTINKPLFSLLPR